MWATWRTTDSTLGWSGLGLCGTPWPEQGLAGDPAPREASFPLLGGGGSRLPCRKGEQSAEKGGSSRPWPCTERLRALNLLALPLSDGRCGSVLPGAGASEGLSATSWVLSLRGLQK